MCKKFLAVVLVVQLFIVIMELSCMKIVSHFANSRHFEK